MLYRCCTFWACTSTSTRTCWQSQSSKVGRLWKRNLPEATTLPLLRHTLPLQAVAYRFVVTYGTHCLQRLLWLCSKYSRSHNREVVFIKFSVNVATEISYETYILDFSHSEKLHNDAILSVTCNTTHVLVIFGLRHFEGMLATGQPLYFCNETSLRILSLMYLMPKLPPLLQKSIGLQFCIM